MKIYISGQISGKEDYKQVFESVEKELSGQGFDVVNPCKLPHDHDKSYESYMKEDIRAMLDCDVIYLIRGWQESPGATLEYEVASKCGLHIMYGGEL